MATTTTPTKGVTDTKFDPYLSPAEVAHELGLSRNYTTRLMREGTIPGVVDLSTGGERATLRVRRSDLTTWAASRALR